MNIDMGTYRLFQLENYIRICSDYNGYTNTKYTFVYSFIFQSGSFLSCASNFHSIKFS